MNLQNYTQISKELQNHSAQLVAVSKMRSVEQIKAMYDEGQRVFGENRVQELAEKQTALPNDIQWHLIGHLQRNKVKYIAPFVHMIHSVDGWSLLEEISKRAEKEGRIIDCLLQIHIAQESSKFGLNEMELGELLQQFFKSPLSHVRLVGLMGMATFTDQLEEVRLEFRYLKKLFDKTKSKYFEDAEEFKEISMGMSGDYKIALEEGSSMIRVGSLVFN